MQNAGIAVICPVLLNRHNRTIEEFIKTAKNNIIFYQKIFGTKNKSKVETYIKYFDSWVNKILKITSKININQRPKVYYVGGPNIYETHGKKSSTYWYIKIAGGEMIPAIDTTFHVNVSAEQIAALNPDIIMMGRQDSTESVVKNPQLATIKAVKDGKVFITPQGVFYWDHSSEGILLLIYCAKTFYPDLFKDIDFHNLVKNFYSVFYGYILSDDETLRILNHKHPAE
jgi:iron complex transport system substrate-binding protein